MDRLELFAACLVLLSALAGCSGKPAQASDDAEIRDPYCDLAGYFNFTLHNNESGQGTFRYNWSLNNPSADVPMHNGSGKVSIAGFGDKKVRIIIPPEDRYDCRYYVMHINVYCGDKEVASFREQRSPHDWNYSVLPPVKYTVKPEYVYVAFESWVLKGTSGNIEIWLENITYNPPENPLRMEISQFYLILGRKNPERWLASEILDHSDPKKAGFFDADHDGLVSEHDHFVLPSNFSSAPTSTEVSFDCALPFIQRGWWDDDLVLEDRQAILVKRISNEPEKPAKLEGTRFTVELQARNHIRMCYISNYRCSAGGLSGTGKPMELLVDNGQNKTYSTEYDNSAEATAAGDAFFYIQVRDDSGNDRMVTYIVHI